MFLLIWICLAVLLIGALKSRMEWMLDIVTRGILGAIGIYFTNMLLSWVGIALNVGVNAATVLTCGILGIPGFFGLYAMGIYQLL